MNEVDTTAVPNSPPMTSSPSARSKGSFLLVALAILGLDQWSKWMIEAHLPQYASETLIPGLLNFTHVQNTGVAFGLFASHGDTLRTLALSGLGTLALGVVLVYFWQTPASNRLLLTALALVLGGAIGNLMDRVASGGVTDFIDFYVGTYHWHTFNVADSAITVGLVLMAWDAFRSHPVPAEAARAEAA
ncbi:MAG: signal peptidase II [Thermoanaerobaculia bacterium]|nr:signal peptidase II [Thermoanaerobaculia bacterium]